jgi:hypothetical protein
MALVRSTIKTPDKNAGAPQGQPGDEGCGDKRYSPIFHLSIQTALKIVPAIEIIINPAVLSMMASMRLRRALIWSYRMAQTSSCVKSLASVASIVLILGFLQLLVDGLNDGCNLTVGGKHKRLVDNNQFLWSQSKGDHTA